MVGEEESQAGSRLATNLRDKMNPTSRGPLTILTLVKGVVTYIVLLITQFRALITLFITRGPLHARLGPYTLYYFNPKGLGFRV